MTGLTRCERSQSQSNYLMPVNPQGQQHSLLPCLVPEKFSDKHQPSKTLLPLERPVTSSPSGPHLNPAHLQIPSEIAQGTTVVVQQPWSEDCENHGTAPFVSTLI